MTADQAKSKVRMFVVPVDIFDVPNLSIYEKMTYIVIQSHTNARNNTAFPSYSTIAKEGSMSRPSAIKAVQGLVEKGLLRKEIRLDVSKNRKVKNTSNLYTVELPEVVNDMTTLVNDMTTPSKQYDHPGHVVYPNNNHLTKPSITKPINNNITNQQIETKTNHEQDPVVVVAQKHKLNLSKRTLNKWRKFEANDENIILAIQETVKRADVKNLVGYITSMLQAGYTTPQRSRDIAKYKGLLPKYIEKQTEQSPTIELTEEQKEEAEKLLRELEELK